MIHYTLNTGHSRNSPRSEVADEVILALAPLLRSGEHDLPIEGYRAIITIDGGGLLASVFNGPRPCITMAVAPDDAAADAVWGTIEKLYLQIGDMPGFRTADFAAPQRPATTPWCAAFTAVPTAEEAYWIADFERCLAWAWIETKGANNA